MQKKVFRILATDFCCWFPISLIAILSIAGVPISNTAYAVSAIILLPINSALNPIIYSNNIEIATNGIQCCKKGMENFFNLFKIRTWLGLKRKHRQQKAFSRELDTIKQSGRDDDNRANERSAGNDGNRANERSGGDEGNRTNEQSGENDGNRKNERSAGDDGIHANERLGEDDGNCANERLGGDDGIHANEQNKVAANEKSCAKNAPFSEPFV